MKNELGKLMDGKGSMTLDVARLVETRLLAVANSGGGKSWLLRKLIEISHGQVQQIILDVEGDFASLREKLDFVLVGKGGDIQADPRLAETLAHKVLELGVSVIIDLYELPHRERIRFVRLFLESMVNAPKDLWHPCLVFLDEAHIFAPEKGEAESLNAVIDIGSRGRKRGFCLIPATQRLAKLHKDVAGECRNKVIGLANLEIDRKRAAEELGFYTREQILPLRDMEAGEFYAIGPALSKQVAKVMIGPVITSHPKAGQVGKLTVPAPTAKIKGILSKLADLPQQAETDFNDKAAMRSRIKELEGKLKAVPKAEVNPDQVKALVEKEVALTKLAMTRTFQKSSAAFKALMSKELEQLLMDFENVPVKFTQIHVPPAWTTPQPKVEAVRIYSGSEENLKLLAEAKTDGFGKCEKSILNFLFSKGPNEAMTKVQVAAICGYAPGGGGFNNSIGKLVTQGLVQRVGGERLSITALGNLTAPTILGPDAHAPGPDAMNAFIGKLGKCEREIFRCIKDNFPNPIPKDQVAASTGYEAGGGGFNNAIGRLCTLGLAVRVPGTGSIQLNPEVGNL